jgi:hypothetical protein
MGFNNHCGACPKCLEPVHSAPYGVLVLCDWCKRPTKGSTKALILHYRGYNPPKHRRDERAILAFAFRHSHNYRLAQKGVKSA